MNECTSKGGVARAHSDNGNLRDDGARLFSYDYKNRLVAAFRKSDSAPIAAYLYLSDNRRTKKTVFSQVPGQEGQVETETLFFYDGWQVCEEQSGAGVTETTYVYNPVYIDEVCQVVRTGAHSLGAGALWTHQNARADVVAVSDAAGVVVERRFFDDFGRSLDEGKQPVAGSAVGNPYGFQGRRLDPETGLYYFRNRYYDPGAGRFLQRDPVWDAGNFGGQYSFVGNGPVSRTDPSGTQSDKASAEFKALGAALVAKQKAANRLRGKPGYDAAREEARAVWKQYEEYGYRHGFLELETRGSGGAKPDYTIDLLIVACVTGGMTAGAGGAAAGAGGEAAGAGLEAGAQEVASLYEPVERVRHHTDPPSMEKIKQSNQINPGGTSSDPVDKPGARGAVDVERSPFGSAKPGSQAGPAAHLSSQEGAFVEFDASPREMKDTPEHMKRAHPDRRVGRIYTDSPTTPLDLGGRNPEFKKTRTVDRLIDFFRKLF